MANNEVRQILMNELQLTREVVREEMTLIIKETIERHFNSGKLDRTIAQIVERKIQEIISNSNSERYSFKSLQTEVTGAVRNLVASEIRRLVRVELSLRDEEDAA